MNHLITSIMTKNDFPQYSDGDVLIVLNPELQFQLHSLTLRTNSTFFREVLTDESGVVLAPKAKKNGVRIRWRVELQLPSADGDDDGEGGEAGKLKLRVRVLLQPAMGGEEWLVFYSDADLIY